MKKIILHGARINVDDDARELIIFLENHVTRDEFETIFGYAKYKQKAYFQDRDRHHFEVSYDDGTYTINDIS